MPLCDESRVMSRFLLNSLPLELYVSVTRVLKHIENFWLCNLSRNYEHPSVYKVKFKLNLHLKTSLPSTLVTMGSDLECMASSYIILLPKLFWPTVRKKCSNDREKLLKFEAEGREFSKLLRLLEQFIQTVKGQNNFW